MTFQENIDKLAEETVLLEPGNLQACARMLTLLESIDHHGVDKEKALLIEYLEAMIMNDIEGGAPDIEDIAILVEKMQNIIRGDVSVSDVEVSSGEVSAPVAEKSEISEPEPDSGSCKAQEKSESTDTTAEITEDLDLMMDFISEAKEHLDSIEINMINWEKNPEDKEIINTIFRPFHTIKGVAGFLNLTSINRLSHQLENLLDEAREGRIELSPELSDLIFDGVDILKSMIETNETSVQSGQPQQYTVDIDTYLQRLSMFLNTPQMKSDSGDEVVEFPKQPLGEILVKEGKVKEDEIKEVLEKQKDQEVPKPIGEMLIEEKKVTPRDVSNAIRKQNESAAPAAGKHIKVDTEKMDQLLDLVGELVIAQSMVTHNPEVVKISSQRFVRDISQLTRIISTLQNISMSMRLVPIGATFQKMNRIVRDLAKKAGKKINLVLEGQSAEIDRNMVEELYDPLVHMIRNSCDHGIKTPEERVEKGKPEEGTVFLKAEHVGGKVVITIADDGDGLDRDAILSKTCEKGLVQSNEQPDEKTIDNMIFMAGFSTSKQVTDVSGRGVGMDVVRKAIEKLHGNVEISSRTDLGTTFTINLPLTTAIIDGMVIQIGSERYIIPTMSVRQLVHPQSGDMNSIIGKGETVKVRGKILPLVRLNNVLEIDCEQRDTANAVLVIVEDDEEVVALQVDSVIGKQEVVIKRIESSAEQMKGVAGGAILGDGRVGLILDIKSIINPHGKIALGA